MKRSLSASAINRLPNAIKELGEKEQSVFVLLRMKRDEVYIAINLEIPISEARELIHSVQTALAKSGSLDLVQDPVFYPIDHPVGDDDGDSGYFQLAGEQMEISDQVALDRFYQILERSICEMEKEDRRLLGLWFNKEMKAREILSFYKNIGIDISPKKPIVETETQDVFYAIEKNIQKLSKIVRSYLAEEGMEAITPTGLKAILDETGVL